MIFDHMAHKVNLDSLIEREDFEITDEKETYDPVFTLPELEQGKNTFKILRKPQFQRGTSEWKPEQVVELVKNFVDRDLIPAIVIWNSKTGLQFVIDGAHRLSALIAWVNDDYGNGLISQKLSGQENISDAQKAAHKKTKILMEDVVGSYKKLVEIGSSDDVGTPVERKRAMGMNSYPIAVQSYAKQDPHKAEASFYRINQGGVALNDEEREIIRTRKWPESIAAKALWRAGNKRHYKSLFPDRLPEIEGLASEIRNLLLIPELETQIYTMELPVAGSVYTNDGLGILDRFIHLANKLPERTRHGKGPSRFDPLPEDDPKADLTGETVIAYLRGAKKLAEVIASNKPFSFGLHPAVYAYSKSGKFLPSAFYGEILFIQDILATHQAHRFTSVRADFEQFLVDNKHCLSNFNHDIGAGMKSAGPLAKFYKVVLDALTSGVDVRAHLASVNPQYVELLKMPDEKPLPPSKKISPTASFALKFRTILQGGARCPECNARIYKDAWTHGHMVDASKGGSAHSDNLAMSHPFCNSGYRTKLQSDATKEAEHEE